MTFEVLLAIVVTVLFFAALFDLFTDPDTPLAGSIVILPISYYICSHLLPHVSNLWLILATTFCAIVAITIWVFTIRLFSKSFKVLEGKALNTDPSGQEGVFRLINDETFVKWNGDLWMTATPNTDKENFTDGQRVKIVHSSNGKLTVKEL